MSKIKNGGLDQYGTGPFEQQQFGTAVEGVKDVLIIRRCTNQYFTLLYVSIPIHPLLSYSYPILTVPINATFQSCPFPTVVIKITVPIPKYSYYDSIYVCNFIFSLSEIHERKQAPCVSLI